MESTELKYFYKLHSRWEGIRNNYPPNYGYGHIVAIDKLSVGSHSKVRKRLCWLFPLAPLDLLPVHAQEANLTALLCSDSFVLWLWLGLAYGKHQQENATWDLAPFLAEYFVWLYPFMKAIAPTK